MKASKEMAIDTFIRGVMRQDDVETWRDIVEAAEENFNEAEAAEVESFLRAEKSEVWKIPVDQCSDCGKDMVYDSLSEVYYCPICEL